MEIEHRTSMGILSGEDEKYVSTASSDENGSYCRLGMEAPLLQFEAPMSKRAVKFYFGIHMIAPSAPNAAVLTDYYICHGDQFLENVFIAALHEEGTKIPTAFLCLAADAYLAWMFPDTGKEPTIPAEEVWSLHDATEFCRANIKRDLPTGEPTELTIHMSTKSVFEVKAVAAIQQLAEAKASGNFAMIFNSISAKDSNNGNGSKNPPKNSKAAGVVLPPREKLPRGGIIFLAEKPNINVNGILEGVAATAAKGKTAKVEKAAKGNFVPPPKDLPKNKRKGTDDPSFLNDPPKTPKTPKAAPGSQSTDSSMLQPLVSALSAVVSKLSASSPTVPTTPAVLLQPQAVALPTRAELRIESKHDHTLRQEIRMDELKYIREMKSIFTEQPATIAPAIISAAMPTPVSMTTPTQQNTPTTNNEMDLNEAWRILSNADSWQNSEEKDVVLSSQIGATSQSDLSFLDSGDLKVLVGKLKLVQANRLKRALNLI